jgi:drug/metabolite transporter (DMT)-like permease
MDILGLVLAGACGLASSVSQTLLKSGLAGARLPQQWSDAPGFVWFCVTNPFVLTSLSLQVFSYSCILLALQRGSMVSIAGTMGTVFYASVAVIGWVFFRERLSVSQWMGVAIMIVGLWLILSPPKQAVI